MKILSVVLRENGKEGFVLKRRKRFAKGIRNQLASVSPASNRVAIILFMGRGAVFLLYALQPLSRMENALFIDFRFDSLFIVAFSIFFPRASPKKTLSQA